jgi:hypothetical protein
LRSAIEDDAEDNSRTAVADPDLLLALRVANGTVRHLSRTHTAWRNTCLYRSLAQYLVLRDFGRKAAIRIGVRDPADREGIMAHSWVLYHGPEPVQDGGDSFEELRFQS